MNSNFFRLLGKTDWALYFLSIPLVIAGLITMYGFGVETTHFSKQLIWVVLGTIVFFIASRVDLHFLRRTHILFVLYNVFILILLVLFIVGHTIKGSQSWFSFGSFSFQPADTMKLILVLVCAKYFSRRHVEIKHYKHILISGIYMLIPFLLVFLQPDFGSAIIIFLIWFGMTLFSGLSKKHLMVLSGVGLIFFVLLWLFVFKPYQKNRVINFINPTHDVRGSGYNVRQSMIAVGSGTLLGKGVGFGTQSRLQFLPEYETDFIFAAFAEEWGFIGACLLLIFFALLIFRILTTAQYGSSNFEILTGIGVTIFLLSHIFINIGMNLGSLPVTGITLPFMSYGGSHLLTEYAALGIISSIRRERRRAHRDDMEHEFLGLE